jgi:hypothetical protein
VIIPHDIVPDAEDFAAAAPVLMVARSFSTGSMNRSGSVATVGRQARPAQPNG